MGSAGSLCQAACRAIAEQPIDLLENASYFLKDGEFDYQLYNYLFMSTINQELAMRVFHSRMHQSTAFNITEHRTAPRPASAH